MLYKISLHVSGLPCVSFREPVKMDKATAAIPASLDETGSSRIRKLEARYIELLEKRVADLEAILSNTDKEVSRCSSTYVIAH
jgi:hypothetical protein